VKADAALLWILMALLFLAMVLTVLFAPRRSLHGYGLLTGPGTNTAAGPVSGPAAPCG
jgi:hypothetical protein